MNQQCFWLAVVTFAGVSTVQASTYSMAVLADNPYAYWQFEDGSLDQNMFGQIAKDSVGGSEFGTYPGLYSARGDSDGPSLAAGVPGIGGLAAHFKPIGTGVTSDYVITDTLGNLGSSIDNTGISVELWFKNLDPTITAQQRLFGVYNNRPSAYTNFGSQVHFGINDSAGAPAGTGGTLFFMRDDEDHRHDAAFPDSQVNLSDGNWHHIVVLYDPALANGSTTAMSIYVDGQMMTVTSRLGVVPLAETMANFDKPLLIGAENQQNANAARVPIRDGLLDEFAIYNYPLTAAQIQAHYAAAVPPTTPGDFDGDGDVDGADFVAWQTNFPKATGATLAEGDADGDGDIDGADFVVWQTNFPFTPAPGGSPVPEPAAWILALGALLAGARPWRRDWRAARSLEKTRSLGTEKGRFVTH